MSTSYPKDGSQSRRKLSAGCKQTSEQMLRLGEPAQLPGGVSIERLYSGNYSFEHDAQERAKRERFMKSMGLSE